ncbi:Isochorismatase-like protein [Chaetomidium leptoderma]|uniref:Isochorismatase-like protein n=1 Tax=Chaetomidium leptoderma TaxID=669021 RepID=A0AAN6VE07_9PEZI|nr:Isochorismatase-like protein [Chaetomidium leptoderma]
MTTALFVIDIQNDLATDPETRIPHAERINTAGQKILSVARAILEAQQGQTPAIFFVQHEEKPEDGPLVRDSEPWKLVFEPHAHAHRERRIPKWTRDTFESNPNLASELKAAGIGEIIAFGIQSECCVESTCSGAIAAGFKVTLLSGAHSTYNSGSKTAEEIEREVEERLRAKGAMVVPWEEAVAAWERNERLSC